MRWSVAGSRLAVTLRRLRGRFGIAAPRVAVTTHFPWYWRALAVTLMAAFALALARWIYDAGRQFAGFDRRETAQEIVSLQGRVAELEAELSGVRKLAASGESSLQIERTTQQQLSQQVRILEVENARLKEDLAAFEQLSSGEGQPGGLTIGRLRIEPTGKPGEYRYALLAIYRAALKSHEFNGLLKFVIALQRDGRDAIMEIPSATEAGASQYQLSIKNFRKIEGNLALPPGATVKSVEVHITQGGVVKASRRTTL